MNPSHIPHDHDNDHDNDHASEHEPTREGAEVPGGSLASSTGGGWVADAIRQQEEHIKRSSSCMGVRYRSHTFRTFGMPSADGTIPNAAMWQACIVCGVTETDADYQVRLAARGESGTGD